MDIRETLLKEHSRSQCNRIVAYIGNHQERFDELVSIFLNDEFRIVQRAAWPLSYCVIEHPALIKKHLKKIVLNLKKDGLHNAVRRNTVRLLQHVEIPEFLQGEVMNICFGYVADPKEAVAVKAFSLTVLQNLAKTYPEIIPELKLLIEEQMPHQTAAFKSRAKKVLKQI
ncbi:MAG: hypothetical protein KIT80_11205 [Chitinophagaceae bacterium]|nr:hypothetical protein [Chitinophagaceae bacterium]MCW5927470.1 hypothetical protein [Chitinophagaceae bacterium]